MTKTANLHDEKPTTATADEQQQKFILNEKLNKILWKLSLPAIVAMVLYGLNAFLDTVFVGQLIDETALAGVSVAYPLTSIMLGFGSLIGTGAAAILSIAIGSNDLKKQKQILSNSTILSHLTTIIFAIPAYIFADDLIYMMGGRGEIQDIGVEYLRPTLIGSFFWIYGLGINLIVRGEGKMKEAAFMSSYGLILNIILTPIFISVFNMGVSGAAWGTNIGMIIYSLVGYLYFARKKGSFESDINSLKFDSATTKAILSAGFPGFIMAVMGLLQAAVVFNALNSYGSDQDLAIYGAANRIYIFLMTPLFGLKRALQPVTGINFGANKLDRVKRS